MQQACGHVEFLYFGGMQVLMSSSMLENYINTVSGVKTKKHIPSQSHDSSIVISNVHACWILLSNENEHWPYPVHVHQHYCYASPVLSVMSLTM